MNESKNDPFAAVSQDNPLVDLDELNEENQNTNTNNNDSNNNNNNTKEEDSTSHSKKQSVSSSSSSSTSKRTSKSGNNSGKDSNAKPDVGSGGKDPVLVIEEALAELKLVKDALLGNLDETQLEAWLDWSFVDTEEEPPLYGTGLPPVKHKSGRDSPRSSSTGVNGQHRRNISSSGLLPPHQAMRAAQSTSSLKKSSKAHSPSHPLA